MKFHVELTRGSKRGIPRALRFVLMEISLAARPLRGRIELAEGMGDVDAVVDLLGGDRSEVAAALARFTAGEEPTLVFLEERGRRYLAFPSWERWNGAEPPTTSAERMRRMRERRAASDDTGTPVTRDADVTERDASRGEERRSEETRSSGGVDPVPGTTARATPPLKPPRVPPPDEASEVEHAILTALREASGGALASEATVEFARSLSPFANTSAHAGKLELADVVLGVEQAAELVAAERAGPDHVPRAGPDLRKYVTAIVRKIQRGEARRLAKRRADPDGDDQARDVVRAFGEIWREGHGGRAYVATAGDAASVCGLLVWATHEGARLGYDSPSAALLRAARDYVRDPEIRLRDNGHPLSWMAGWLRSYALPPAKLEPRKARLSEARGGPPPADVLALHARGGEREAAAS